MKKGIRFESGTTAITVFDEMKSILPLGEFTPEKDTLFAAYIFEAAYHKSGYLPYFQKRFTVIGREECNRLSSAVTRL